MHYISIYCDFIWECMKREEKEKGNEGGMGIKGEKMNLDIIICFQGIVNTDG